jgi:hypothetical protein
VYANFDEDNLLKEIDTVNPIVDKYSMDIEILEDVLADEDA